MDINFDFDKESPFESGQPVRPDFFVGRKNIIEKILRYANNVVDNQCQHFYITGNRGMGKTSLAFYVSDFLEEYNFTQVYISNKGNDSVDNLAVKIIESLFNKLPKDTLPEKVKSWFGENINSFEFKGAKVEFNLNKTTSEDVKRRFPYYLRKAYDEFPSDDRKAILLIIDDINGLSKTDEFVDWYKSFSETVISDDIYRVPIYFILTSYPETYSKLTSQEPSFGRIFNIGDLEHLEGNEVFYFYKTLFNDNGIVCDDNVLDLMCSYSKGVPLMMQQIGDSVFWEVKNNHLTTDDAMRGIMISADEIGKKQISSALDLMKLLGVKDIFHKLGKYSIYYWNFDDLNSVLSEGEVDLLRKSVDELLEYHILMFNNHNSKYEFKDKLYEIYFTIKALDE